MTRMVLTLICLNVLLTSMAQVVLKAGMSDEAVLLSMSGESKWAVVLTIATNPFVIGGLLMYVGGAFIWLFVLARVEVSFAYPFVGLGFIVTMLLGWQIYGDSLTLPRVLGTLLIAVGVGVLARS